MWCALASSQFAAGSRQHRGWGGLGLGHRVPLDASAPLVCGCLLVLGCCARSLGSSGGAWPASLLGAGGFLGPRGPVLDMRQGSWCLVRDSGTPTPSSPPAGMSGLRSPRCADSGLGSPGSISICLWLLGAMILTSHPHVQTLAIHLCTLSFLLYSLLLIPSCPRHHHTVNHICGWGNN